MVREDCPEKVVFKQIPEIKEEAKLCGYHQEEHSSWRELSRMCTCWKDKKGIMWPSEPRGRTQSRTEGWQEPGQGPYGYSLSEMRRL